MLGGLSIELKPPAMGEGENMGRYFSMLVALMFGMMMILVIYGAPPMLWAKNSLQIVAQDAARIASISADPSQVQSEIQAEIQNQNLPTTWNGQTLFNYTVNGTPGYSYQLGPNVTTTTVTINYNVPVPFDKVLTGFGGPLLSITVPISITGTYYNETQYTGTGS